MWILLLSLEPIMVLEKCLTFAQQLVQAGIGDLGHRLSPGSWLLAPNTYSQS